MHDNIHIWWDEEFQCYDLRALADEATVADMEEACEIVFSDQDARMKYSDRCKGCCICCGGRIPLTAGDVARLRNAGVGDGLDEGWLNRFVCIVDLGNCLDITLKCHDDEICSLWDRKKCLCSCYDARPFVCRTYICAPFSRRLEALRTEVVNHGEDILSEMIRMNDLSMVDVFATTPLKNICSPRLWYILKQE